MKDQKDDTKLLVTPAKAGVQEFSDYRVNTFWIPAFAGMTSYRSVFSSFASPR
jgi:hypothetical protein